MPGPSTVIEDEPENDSLHHYVSKVLLKTILAYTEQLLYKNNLIASGPSAVITKRHMQIGKEIYNKISEILAEKKILVEDELIFFQEIGDELCDDRDRCWGEILNFFFLLNIAYFHQG